ncbi:SDR family oxidoreductase [Streptomyces sp. NPDC002784]
MCRDACVHRHRGARGGEALVAAAVRRYGRLDVLVNSLGVPRREPRQDAEVWREFFDVDVVGTWQMCLAALPQLRAGGAGRAVNVGSLADGRPAGARVPRAVSQAAAPALPQLRAGGQRGVGGRRAVGRGPRAVGRAAALTYLTRLPAAVTGPQVRVDAAVPGLTDTVRAQTCEEVAEAVHALLGRRPDATAGPTGARRNTPALTAPTVAGAWSTGVNRA